MREAIDRVLRVLEAIAMTMAVIAVLAMMASITLDALGRYLFNRPFTGQYEFTSLYLMVILTFMGLAHTQAVGGHISVPLFQGLVAKLPWKLPARLAALCAAVAFGFVTVMAGEDALAKIAARTTTFGAIQFPTYLSYCWMPVGTGLLTLRLIFQTVWPPEPAEEEDIAAMTAE